MSKNTYSIDFVVYIAGVWVPASSISIQNAFNSLPMATIALPAELRLFGIGREDRVPVHIFVKDTFYGDDKYLLFFEGEVKSYSYNSSTISREITINAQSNLAFLMDVKAFFMHTIGDLGSLGMIDPEKEQGLYQMDAYAFPLSLFMKGIAHLDETGDVIEYPSEFLSNLYKFFQDLGSAGVYNQSELAKFYEKHADNISLSKKMVKVPKFDAGEPWPIGFPILKGIQKHAALNHLIGRTTTNFSQGKTGDTIYNWLNYIVSEMQYEFAVLSAPSVGKNMDGETSIGTSMLKPMMYESPPPNCNIIYKSQIDTLRTSEDVYQVPTRILVDNTSGISAQLTGASNEAMERAARTSFYPDNDGEVQVVSEREVNTNIFSKTKLPSEEYTGPYLYETQPPTWTSYIDYHSSEDGTDDKLMKRIMAYLLQLKIYERRNFQASTAFAPYIVPGFPGVIFDSSDSQFVFTGYVTAVNHTLTKNSARTQVSMAFTRQLEEAIGDPLSNPSEEVNSITTDPSACDEIYGGILGGCYSIPFDQVRETAVGPNQDSKQAYDANHRMIVDMREFMDITGLEVEDTLDTGYGYAVPFSFTGCGIDDRRNKTHKLRDLLKEISREYLENQVY